MRLAPPVGGAGSRSETEGVLWKSLAPKLLGSPVGGAAELARLRGSCGKDSNKKEAINLDSDFFYMRAALDEARIAFNLGEIPIGAVLVDAAGEIVARAHNLRETTHDATAHAEILAIRAACERLGRWRLTGCTLYVTIEPCPMCAGAIVNSRLTRVVYGAPDAKAGACESIYNIPGNPNLNHRSGGPRKRQRQQDLLSLASSAAPPTGGAKRNIRLRERLLYRKKVFR